MGIPNVCHVGKVSPFENKVQKKTKIFNFEMEQKPFSKKSKEYFAILEEPREFPYKAVPGIILVY